MEIKKHSINSSAEAFDENSIDAYAQIFLKNFTEICNLFADLGMTQQIKTMLFIEKGQWIKNDNLFKIIGEKSEWKQNDDPIDSYSDEKYNNIINYAQKLFMNEKYKNIEIKHQNNDTLFIFKNNFWKRIIKVIVEKFETDITQFEKWFIKEAKTNINNSNYFSNKIIPLDENLKKIADYLFKNINNYNIFLQSENKEIFLIL
ncbi:hypothetical protein [Spiroplasma endosymbiont of Poecilobothrus nobilitatus]|uniref:hypothetical protein n=1 Tax=Spiroplasma endosymbiont of Poecilobothrus nobilitatus TaxID=1209220 RepID=UPI00313CED37